MYVLYNTASVFSNQKFFTTLLFGKFGELCQ